MHWVNIQLPAQKFLIPPPSRTKFNPRPPRACTQNSAGSRARSVNADIRNPRGFTRPSQNFSARAHQHVRLSGIQTANQWNILESGHHRSDSNKPNAFNNKN